MSNKVWNFATEGVVMAIIISVLLLIFTIGALMCFHFCIVSRAFRRRFRNGSRSMSRDEVEKLPCYDYVAKSKGSSPVDECAVCLENFKKGDKCRLLPLCNHSFHARCVDAWLLKNPNCPICRTDQSRRFGEENSRLSDILMELTSENQSTESTELNDDRIELGENLQRALTGHASDVTGVESVRENQTNPTLLPDSAILIEHV